MIGKFYLEMSIIGCYNRIVLKDREGREIMSEIKDTVFFNLLDQRKTDNAKIYSGLLLQASAEIAKVLELIKYTFPDFPDHGMQHSCRILDYIARVLGDKADVLTDTEIFCFMLSALFHDTGMSLVGFSCKDKLRADHPQNAAKVIDEYFDTALSTLRGRDSKSCNMAFLVTWKGKGIRRYHRTRNTAQEHRSCAVCLLNG